MAQKNFILTTLWYEYTINSAGVGRTGTFIAVDIFLHQLDNDANEIDVFGDVLKLRNHRCNMVQTEVCKNCHILVCIQRLWKGVEKKKGFLAISGQFLPKMCLKLAKTKGKFQPLKHLCGSKSIF